MRAPFLTLIFLVAAVSGRSQELFSARCESALTGRSFPVWRVAETKDGLALEWSDTKKKHSVVLVGEEATNVRAQIDRFLFTQVDADMLGALSVSLPSQKKDDKVIVLRPFDGATYHFVIVSAAGRREVKIENPAFDLEHHYHVAECDRLKAVLAFLDEIECRAKGEKRANQPPEPTATSVTPPAAQESRQP